MTIRQSGDIRWLEFASLSGFPIQHGVFTRHGGVSPAPWNSLNIGGTVGDSTSNTRENRNRILQAMDIPFGTVYDVWQVHSADYVLATRPRSVDEEHVKADILITSKPGLTLLMRFADCVPILAYDPRKHVAGIAHAGWIGTGKDTSGALIRAMVREFGCTPGDIVAAIGPSICQKHYPVGSDVVEIFKGIMPEAMDQIILRRDGQDYLDLWKANTIQLQRAGVEYIEGAGLCTVCHNEDWYSHRKEQGKTGRFGALIRLG